MKRVAVLDDYQRRAGEFADWGSLGPEAEVVFFHEPIEHTTLASTLAGATAEGGLPSTVEVAWALIWRSISERPSRTARCAQAPGSWACRATWPERRSAWPAWGASAARW